MLTREALAAGRDGVARYRRLLSYLAGKLAPGRELRIGEADLPELTDEAVAAGLVGVVAERLAHSRAAELPGMVREAIQFALTPYLGAEEASRIAASIEPEPGTDR